MKKNNKTNANPQFLPILFFLFLTFPAYQLCPSTVSGNTFILIYIQIYTFFPFIYFFSSCERNIRKTTQNLLNPAIWKIKLQ